MKRSIHLYALVVIMAAIVSCSDDIGLDKALNETNQSLAINVVDETGHSISAEAFLIKNNQTISEFKLSSE